METQRDRKNRLERERKSRTELSPEQRERKNRGERQRRVREKTLKPETKPDYSKLGPTSSRPVALPSGDPRILPLADKASQGKAACGPATAHLFDSDASPSDRQQGKALCFSCDIRPDCLTTSLDMDEPRMIWGGFDLGHEKGLAREAEKEMEFG